MCLCGVTLESGITREPQIPIPIRIVIHCRGRDKDLPHLHITVIALLTTLWNCIRNFTNLVQKVTNMNISLLLDHQR